MTRIFFCCCCFMLACLFRLVFFKFNFVLGRSYKGREKIKGNMEISGVRMNDVKSTKNNFFLSVSSFLGDSEVANIK